MSAPSETVDKMSRREGDVCTVGIAQLLEPSGFPPRATITRPQATRVGKIR